MSGPESKPVTPYCRLAELYDRIMSHVDYDNWFHRVHGLFEQYYIHPNGLNGKALKLLECACGTGSMALRMALNGHKLYAFDQSGEMLQVAKAKTAYLRKPPLFQQADFLQFKIPEQVNIAYCLYDSINYLQQPDDVVQFLNRVAGNLKPEGLFLFDISTVYNSETHFTSSMFNGRAGKISYTRRMVYNREDQIQENHFTINYPNGESFSEQHLQKIYTLDQIREIVERSDLRLTGEHDLDKMSPPVWNSLRINFVCMKAEK